MYQSKCSPEKKFELVLRALRGESIANICRENQISPTLFYRWRDDFLQGAQEALKDKRN
ncbi:MAG: helix-turn-helix domain-containing protein, partial [Candidatus Edwardsbacteria bacterium]